MATAMLIPCSLALLGSIYKEGPRKNIAFSLFAAGSPTGFTLAGVFSGLLTKFLWWPWIFWVTAAVCCCLVVISYSSIPSVAGDEPLRCGPSGTQQPQSKVKTSHLKFDLAGTTLGVSGLILFNVAWNQAPTTGWSAPSCIATLVVGFALLLGFSYIESRTDQPIIPLDCLSVDTGFVLATMALTWASFGVFVFYLIHFITRLRGDSVLSAGIQFIPVPFAGFAASYLNSMLLRRGVSPVDILAFSCIWFLVGNILLATMPIHQSFWLQTFWVQILTPMGIDLSFPSATLTISRLVPPERQGVAASLITTVVYYAQSLGLGMAGTVQSQVSHDELNGYRVAWYTGIGLSSLGLLVALCPVVRLRLKVKSRDAEEPKI